MNRFKTVLLLSLLTGLFMIVGNQMGGQQGMLIGLLMAGVSNFFSYFFSDRMVLAQYGAKEVTASQQPHLFAMVERLARQGDMPMPKVYLIDMEAPNAFATGRSPSHAAIAVSPSIMKLMTNEELEGVIAHELGHVKNYDILISSMAATIAGALSYLAHMAYYINPGSRSRDEEGRGSSPISLLFMVIVTPLIGTLLHLAVSRQREYGADEYGAQLTRNPRALASALTKLGGVVAHNPATPEPGQESTAHLFIINPFDTSFIQSLFSTHPPLAERISRLKALKV